MEDIDVVLSYAEYVSEMLEKNISYVDYVIESINNNEVLDSDIELLDNLINSYKKLNNKLK